MGLSWRTISVFMRWFVSIFRLIESNGIDRWRRRRRRTACLVTNCSTATRRWWRRRDATPTVAVTASTSECAAPTTTERATTAGNNEQLGHVTENAPITAWFFLSYLFTSHQLSLNLIFCVFPSLFFSSNLIILFQFLQIPAGFSLNLLNRVVDGSTSEPEIATNTKKKQQTNKQTKTSYDWIQTFIV